jgi:hypothetical protein
VRAWLFNRFTATLGVLVVVIGGWNLYVIANDDGVLAGRVVGPDGTPVAGAEVVLAEQTVAALMPLSRLRSDADGRFRFQSHGKHSVVLTASKPGFGASDRVRVKLLFRNQNTELSEPLRLKPT